MTKRLYRSRVDCKIGGVCAGLADYFNIDPTIVRIIAILLIFADGIGVLAYIIAWIAIPRQPLGSSGEVVVETPAETSKAVQTNGESKTKNTTIFGVILIVIGILFLFKNSYWWFDISELWPILLVVIGILMLIRHSNKDKDKEDNNSGGEVTP